MRQILCILFWVFFGFMFCVLYALFSVFGRERDFSSIIYLVLSVIILKCHNILFPSNFTYAP